MVAPLLNLAVTVAPTNSSPPTLPDSAGPGALAPLMLVGSMSMENSKRSPRSKPPKRSTSTSKPPSRAPSKLWLIRPVPSRTSTTTSLATASPAWPYGSKTTSGSRAVLRSMRNSVSCWPSSESLETMNELLLKVLALIWVLRVM